MPTAEITDTVAPMIEGVLKPEPEFVPGFEKAEGRDLRIISADNYAFMFSSSLLRNAASVFEGMLESCDSSISQSIPTLQLSDKDLELSWELEIFLKWIEDPHTARHQKMMGSGAVRAVRLAKKYDCVYILELVELNLLRSLLHVPKKAGASALAAAAMGRWHLCGKLIKALEISKGSSEYEEFDARRMFDPRGQDTRDREVLSAVGNDFLYTVNRAAASCIRHGASINYVELGAKIAMYMEYAE